MSFISNSIGKRFEDIFTGDFPDFKRVESEDNILPDFFNGSFWIEAKVAYRDYGVRLKQVQIDNFRRLKEPVIYIVGFHNLYGTLRKLIQRTERGRQRYLERHMGMDSAYFVTDDVIRAIWNREHRLSRKKGLIYCTLKMRFLKNIIDNNSFKRNGEELVADEYYGIDRGRLALQHTKKSVSTFPYGFLLDRKKDKKCIEYLKERSLV